MNVPLKITERMPNITKATIKMSYANNGIYQGRTEDDVIAALEEVLGAEGVYEEDLIKIDNWLGTLTEEELETVIDGEQTEMLAITARSPDPEKTEGLLEDIFNHAA